MAEAVITTDSGFTITSWNRAAEMIYGVACEDALGQHVQDVFVTVWESDSQRESSLYTLRTGGRWQGEVVQRRKDGQQLNILSSVTLILGQDGQRVGVVAVNRDITSQRRAESTLAQVEARLTEVQRTDALGQLAGSVAHDFNNLLAVISGHAELALARVPEESRATRSLKQILASVERGSTLTRQLLYFGRSDLLDVGAVDLVALIRGIDQVLARVLRLSNKLIFTLPDSPVWVRARRGELEQVLFNLCSNAREALPEPGQVEIAVERVGEDSAALHVSDNGVGMSPEVSMHAFEPFFTTRASGSGTGLGLAVVSRVATRVGGRAELRSEPGRGTRVSLYLPTCEPERPDVPRPPPPAGRRLRVLLAEDQSLVLDVLAELLRRLGHEVSVARNGVEAVAIGSRETFDVMVTDVSMPGMSGPAAAAALQARGRRFPVVYVSGFPRNEAEIRAAQWPRGVWRQKPVTLDSLQTALDEAMAARA